MTAPIVTNERRKPLFPTLKDDLWAIGNGANADLRREYVDGQLWERLAEVKRRD